MIACQLLHQHLAAALLGHGTVVLGTHQALADALWAWCARSPPGCCGTVGAWGRIGLVRLLAGARGFCPAYPLLGLNTCPLKHD